MNITISRFDGEAPLAGATIMALEHAMSSLLGEPVPATPPNRWARGHVSKTHQHNTDNPTPALHD